jgi:hypothetical protein
MSENVLKKNFKQKDVQRLRNLVQGKNGERTTAGIGYEKKKSFYNEGDVWEEDGRQWTIKNGIKQNLTKLDKAKQSITLPLFCPCCSNLMKNKFDKIFYIQYNRCFNCQIDFETDIRKMGLWEEYEKNIINSDLDNIIKEYSVWVDEIINSSNESYITEAGDVEKWVGSAKNKLLQNKEETIKYLQTLKKM